MRERLLRLTYGVGLLLQILGVAAGSVAWRPDVQQVINLSSAEPILGLGLLTFAVGTIFCVAALEITANGRGRNGAWSLFGMVSPLGLFVFYSLRGHTKRKLPPVAESTCRQRFDAFVGVGLTVVVLVGIVCGAVLWVSLGRAHTTESGIEKAYREERQAFERLQQIADAQEEYRKQDWDGDGRKEYAKFIIHLWQSVRLEDGSQVDVGLIPRELAFAMVPTYALDGYFYETLSKRSVRSEATGERALDYTREWAMIAAPRSMSRNHGSMFLADSTGKFFVGPCCYRKVFPCPADPIAEGWTEIKSMSDLERFQKKHAVEQDDS